MFFVTVCGSTTAASSMQDGTSLLNLSHAGHANPQKSKLPMMTVSDGDAKAVVQTSSAAAA